jgi:poly(3-hydroxyalkanoate) synthetase
MRKRHRQLARQTDKATGSSGNDDARVGKFGPFLGPELLFEAWRWWLGDRERPRNRVELSWTTPDTIALELTTMRLRDFSTRDAGRALLICAPYALHSALITDFAPGYSIVEVLREGGVGRLYVTDWRSATADMRYLSIDSYLADLNVAVDAIGSPVDLAGLCQGGWLSLLYAARFPEKVRRLVLVGAPVDVSRQSPLSGMAANLLPGAFDALVSPATGLVSGKQLNSVWSSALNARDNAVKQSFEAADDSEDLLHRFERWNDETLDLPGVYYVQVSDWIFRENRIAQGRFVALGRQIDPARLKAPAFLLVGAEDRVVPAEQALATAKLLGTPRTQVQVAVEPCGHLGLFMGRDALNRSWRRIAGWLASDEPWRRSDPGAPSDLAAAIQPKRA